MIQEFLNHLKRGPTSFLGAVVFGICILACIVWLALAMGYTDEVSDAEKRRLWTFHRIVWEYAPPKFVRSARWFFLGAFLLYVISVYL